MGAERCNWCGEGFESGEGYRAAEPAGERRAAFCRLEHVVPWAINGARWDAGSIEEPAASRELELCAQCRDPSGEAPVLLVHHRGEHRIADAFCSVDHLRVWASSGGRWRS
jgi:hypothetical protein